MSRLHPVAGGRGIRPLQQPRELEPSLARHSEGTKGVCFADVFLEKNGIVNPKHIEAQILADQQGAKHRCTCFERDCSNSAARNQKTIEIAPKPSVGRPKQRAYIGERSKGPRPSGYENAGTWSFCLPRRSVFNGN